MSFRKDDAMSFRGDLDPSYLVRLQTNRCAMIQTTGDESTFGGSVLALLAMVPQTVRDEIESEKSAYTEEKEDYDYKRIGGWKVGTPEKPVYTNLPEDEDYDPNLKGVKTVKKIQKDEATGEEYEIEEQQETTGEPLLVSPKLVKKEVVDYYKLLILIQKKLEEKGLSWKVDPINEEAGRIPEEKEVDYPPTPTDKDGKPLVIKDADTDN